MRISLLPSCPSGQCVALSENNGVLGPAIILTDPQSNGAPCEPNNKPSSREAFAVGADGSLTVGTKALSCVAGEHGRPSPFGPMQLYAKQLQKSPWKVAVLLVNRAAESSPVVQVNVSFAELPGFYSSATKSVSVRDVWTRKDRPGIWARFGHVLLSAGGDDSDFVILGYVD